MQGKMATASPKSANATATATIATNDDETQMMKNGGNII